MKFEFPYDNDEYPWSIWQAILASGDREGPGPCYTQDLGDGKVGGRLVPARERKQDE